jgi:N-acetylneuraminic acid mutarotase
VSSAWTGIGYSYVLPSFRLSDVIGIWRIAPTGKLPTGRAALGAVQANARLYVIGGNDANGQYYNSLLSARFDFGQPQ